MYRLHLCDFSFITSETSVELSTQRNRMESEEENRLNSFVYPESLAAPDSKKKCVSLYSACHLLWWSGRPLGFCEAVNHIATFLSQLIAPPRTQQKGRECTGPGTSVLQYGVHAAVSQKSEGTQRAPNGTWRTCLISPAPVTHETSPLRR